MTAEAIPSDGAANRETDAGFVPYASMQRGRQAIWMAAAGGMVLGMALCIALLLALGDGKDTPLAIAQLCMIVYIGLVTVGIARRSSHLTIRGEEDRLVVRVGSARRPLVIPYSSIEKVWTVDDVARGDYVGVGPGPRRSVKIKLQSGRPVAGTHYHSIETDDADRLVAFLHERIEEHG